MPPKFFIELIWTIWKIINKVYCLKQAFSTLWSVPSKLSPYAIIENISPFFVKKWEVVCKIFALFMTFGRFLQENQMRLCGYTLHYFCLKRQNFFCSWINFWMTCFSILYYPPVFLIIFLLNLWLSKSMIFWCMNLH